MPKPNPLAEQQKTLLTIVAEAAARKKIAKSAGIKSGCLPLLAGIIFRSYNGQNTRPGQLYSAAVVNNKLARAYIRLLIDAGLVRLQVIHGCRWLGATLAGMGVAANYAREVRSNSRAFTQV